MHAGERVCVRARPAAAQAHIAACKELSGSATFKQLLGATLAVGNFLNHGSRLGNAGGFRLRGLNKLHDSRSLDGKSNMLQVRRAASERAGAGEQRGRTCVTCNAGSEQEMGAV